MKSSTSARIMIMLVLLTTFLTVGNGQLPNYIRFGRSLKTRTASGSTERGKAYIKRKIPEFNHEWEEPSWSARTYGNEEPNNEPDFADQYSNQ